MSLIIVPEALKSKLANVDARVEVCSADGRVLGYFTPEKSVRNYNLDPGISDEELMRRVAEEKGQGQSIEEIFRELEEAK